MLYLCCLLTIASAFAEPDTHIVEGAPAQTCEYPSIVHLQVYNQPTDDMISMCGGTLIDATHVLTAAHCLEGNVRKVSVNVGSNLKWNFGQQSRMVSTIVKHSGYVDGARVIKKDIAMLTLDKPVQQNKCVKFAPMAKEGENFDRKRCMAAGWGDFETDGNSPDKLYKVALPVIPFDTCRRDSAMVISDGVLCAGDFVVGGGGTCQGDSGGPLYCPSSNGQMVLAGVTSFGSTCDRDVNAFTDVGYFRRWINNHM